MLFFVCTYCLNFITSKWYTESSSLLLFLVPLQFPFPHSFLFCWKSKWGSYFSGRMCWNWAKRLGRWRNRRKLVGMLGCSLVRLGNHSCNWANRILKHHNTLNIQTNLKCTNNTQPQSIKMERQKETRMSGTTTYEMCIINMEKEKKNPYLNETRDQVRPIRLE